MFQKRRSYETWRLKAATLRAAEFILSQAFPQAALARFAKMPLDSKGCVYLIPLVEGKWLHEPLCSSAFRKSMASTSRRFVALKRKKCHSVRMDEENQRTEKDKDSQQGKETEKEKDFSKDNSSKSAKFLWFSSKT